MAPPPAVVIPFGVPEDGRGLGLGLAALVHSFAQIDGESVALAQLLSKQAQDQDEDKLKKAAPVEAFVPPSAWRDLTGTGSAPPGVSFVMTGAFEPPVDGRGLIQLLVFEAKDGRTRACVEAHVALNLRVGNADEAEQRAHEAIALEPDRARLYALLSEARRSRGDLEGALTAIEDGLLHGANDPLLGTERGIVLAERGKLVEA